MEFIYLWVEKYKNIEHQEFNFSPRFECEFYPDYDKDVNLTEKSRLEIREKEYVNIFPENINVTAIVGKNGSGKSNLLEFILDRMAKRIGNETFPKNFILIYCYENKLYQYNNFKYQISTDLNLDEYPNNEDLLDYYKNTIAININGEYKEFETRATQQIFNEHSKYDKNSSNLVIIENYLKYKTQVDKIKEFFFIPHKIKIRIKRLKYHRSILKDNRDYYSDNDWSEIEEQINNLKDKNFIEQLVIIKEIFNLKKIRHKNYDPKYSRLIGVFDDQKNPNQYEFNEELLNDENIPTVLKNYELHRSIKVDDIDENFLQYIKQLPYIFEIDLIDKNSVNMNDLSFGEKQLLVQLHYILNYTNFEKYEEYEPPQGGYDQNGNEIYIEDRYVKYEVNSIIIFIDEFELGLHPHWQKNAIVYIINFLKTLEKNIHIVFTTHSPFLLSDIPKQNIIFLDKEKNGNCKVLSHNEVLEKKQTFGANIHTLLSDSFFMSNGLMGEFAKSKIEEVINFLNNDKSEIKDYIEAESIIDIIGEPILQKKLRVMLERYKEENNLVNPQDIEKQIQALQEKLNRIQKNG